MPPEVAPEPPAAPTKPYHYDFHGRTIDDPYHWLKEKTNSEVIDYIKSENAYREALTGHLRPFQEKLYREMLSHIKQTDLGVPVRENGYWYYSRTEAGKQYPIYCRKQGSLAGAEEILLDVNQLAQGKRYLSVRPEGASDDGQLYAYVSDTTGFREYYLSIKDLKTGKLLEDRFVKAAGFTWAGNGKTVFYVTEDAAKRPHKLFRHTIGEPMANDKLVYEEKDELYRLGIHRTHDKRSWCNPRSARRRPSAGSWMAIRPTASSASSRRVTRGLSIRVDHRDGLFHIRTNKDAAVNFKWMTCKLANTEAGTWQEYEPYRPEVFLERVTLFKDFAVILEREAGIQQLRVESFATRKSYRIPFPEKSYSTGLGANPEFDTTNIHITYTSLVTPLSVYEFNLATQERTLLKATEVPGGFDPANYCQRTRRSNGGRRRESADFNRLPQGARQGWQSAALPLQLRILRLQHRTDIRPHAARALGSRRRLRPRPHSRRLRHGPATGTSTAS